MDKAKKNQLKMIREVLKERSFRERENIFAAEGSKIVTDALLRKKDVKSVFISGRVLGAPGARQIIEICDSMRIDVFRVAAEEFEKLSSLNNSQGVLALISKPSWDTSLVGKFNVLCDGVQDPGNIGAIIRTSAAFGVSSVLLFGTTADPYNPKVVRASSGTLLELPVINVTPEKVEDLRSRGYRIFSAASGRSGVSDIASIGTIGENIILAFGNEGKGLSPYITERSDRLFHIPISPAAESLNVTAAAAIALYCFSSARRENG